MPKVILNNVEYECEVGDRLIDVARNNAAHIGFICGGLGSLFVETSACRVLNGAENLNAPTELEQRWLQPSWIEAGHRLGCEVKVTGNGTVEILSRAEELRRQTVAIFTPPEGTSSGENVGLLFNNMGRIVMNQLVRFPDNVIASVSTMNSAESRTDFQGAFDGLRSMLGDGTRVVQGMFVGTVRDSDQAE